MEQYSPLVETKSRTGVAYSLRWLSVAVATFMCFSGCRSEQTTQPVEPPCPRGIVRTASVESGDTILAVAVCVTPNIGAVGTPVSFVAETAFRDSVRPSLAVCGSSMEYGDEALMGTPVPRCQPSCSTDTVTKKSSGAMSLRIPDHVYNTAGRYTATLTLTARSLCEQTPALLAVVKIPIEIG